MLCGVCGDLCTDVFADIEAVLSNRAVKGREKGLSRSTKRINTRALCAVVTNSIARKGQGRNSLAGSRGSAPCGVWGNAPTVPRPTNPKEAANKSAGSEASLPVTLRSRGSAPKLLYPLLAHCRARWARPHSRSTTPCPCFSPPNGYPTPKDTRKTSGTKPLVFSISRNIHFFSSAR